MSQHPFDRVRHEWAVILAGGDGTRLKSLTRHIAGDERPKQFCSVLGRGTLLEETQRRAALQVAPERTLYVVNRAHENFYSQLFAQHSRANLVVQPSNRGTAPAILYALLRIAARDSHAVVAFFPSDHYISDNEKFMAQMRTALDAAHERAERIVLLGLAPESPEVDYGWIEPSQPIDRQSNLFDVRRFWEKPNKILAQALLLRGCLWNTFVMVASAHTLLEVIESAIPDLYRLFAGIIAHSGSNAATAAIEDLYGQLTTINFSNQVLALKPQRLTVLKVTGIRWNDLGEPKRVMASLEMAGVHPHWAEAGTPQLA